jgi:thiosulfate/3-mercaptopyruvate sulfurtransferase
VIPPFVDYSYLADHPEAVLVDCRHYLDGRSGHDAYLFGHLPGAVFLPLDDYLAAPPTTEGGRHPMPTPDVFAEGMRSIGVSDDSVVIAYDDDSGVMAARLVWLLRITGHQAALLDGGVASWRGAHDEGETTRPRGDFTATPWPEDLFVEMDDLDGRLLLDARPGERFRGEVEMLDARPGHIPGARNVNARESSDAMDKLLPRLDLQAHVGELSEGWVSYCGSGVTACHTLLVAEHLRLPPGRLYAGSWSQWAATERPAELG